MRLFAERIHKHPDPWKEAPPWALELRKLMGLQLYLLEKLMATLDQVLADVTDESTRLDSLSAFIDGLKKQLADALDGTTIPKPVQDKIDAVFAAAEANKAKIDTALNANVPPPPAPAS